MGLGTNSTEQKLGEIVSPVVEELGYSLWGLECTGRGHSSVVRVFIDSNPPGGSISIADVTRVSRQVSMLFDLEEPIQGSYSLEVSSPGIERRLFTLPQCEKYLDEQIELRLKLPQEGRRAFKGRLVQVGGTLGTLTLEENGEHKSFHFEDIRRMYLVWQGEARRDLSAGDAT